MTSNRGHWLPPAWARFFEEYGQEERPFRVRLSNGQAENVYATSQRQAEDRMEDYLSRCKPGLIPVPSVVRSDL